MPLRAGEWLDVNYTVQAELVMEGSLAELQECVEAPRGGDGLLTAVAVRG